MLKYISVTSISPILNVSIHYYFFWRLTTRCSTRPPCGTPATTSAPRSAGSSKDRRYPWGYSPTSGTHLSWIFISFYYQKLCWKVCWYSIQLNPPPGPRLRVQWRWRLRHLAASTPPQRRRRPPATQMPPQLRQQPPGEQFNRNYASLNFDMVPYQIHRFHPFLAFS